MSTEKVLHLKALGAEVRTTRSDVGRGHPAYYQDYAARLALEIPGAFFADQFNNPANPRAHETGTGPEIWEQTGHDVDAIVVGVGSSGTLTGLTRYFRQVAPHVASVLADPAGSILTGYVETGHVSDTSGSWAVEGGGEDFIPAIADMTGVLRAYTITDQESFDTARALLRAEGIMGGSSTGTLLAAALKYCREQTTPQRVVTFVCDTGTRYLSKVYNDGWMFDQGLLPRAAMHDLRDLIGRRYDHGAVVSVDPADSLLVAFNRMCPADLAQLPVIADGPLVGIIDESDLPLAVQNDAAQFTSLVGATMSTRVETLHPDASLAALRATLDRGLTAVVADGAVFFDYGRSHNPTRFARERCVADLEGGAQAFAFASGLAAISTVLELLDAGSHIVAGDDMYGGTYRLFERVRRRGAGLEFSYADLTNPENLLAALRPDTRMVWVETPTNPMLKLADLQAIAAIYRARHYRRDRQYLRQSAGAAPARTRRRYRRTLDDQIPERALRHHRRHRHRRRGRTPGRTARTIGFSAKFGGRGCRSVRQFSGAARHQNAGHPHAAPQRQRARSGNLARTTAGSTQGFLSRRAIAPAARAGTAPDGRLRRHHLDRSEHRSGGGAALSRTLRNFRAGRESRRRRKPDSRCDRAKTDKGMRK